MTSSYVQVAAFNKHLLETIRFLMDRFPKDHHLAFIHAQVEMASKATPRSVVLHFVSETKCFAEQIQKRNADFFLGLVQDKEYDDVLGHLRLDEKWNDFDDEAKDLLWKSIQDLHGLGRNIYPTV